MKILAGDIGGTKTLLQIVEYHNRQYQILAEQRFNSADFETFDLIIQEFFRANTSSCSAIDVACIGVAGPVDNQQAKVTNLPWHMSSTALAQTSGIPQFYLINDFQAIGYSIALLQPNDLVNLQPGTNKARAVRAVIGAGTGLGHAILVWQDELMDYQVLASEAGHSSFAPINALQSELFNYLSNDFECVSWERVISGPGIENIFRFLCAKYKSDLCVELKDRIQNEDATPAIVEAALQNKDAVAVQTLNLFVEAYGAAAGNLALTALSLGGLYVAGGIAPRIVAWLARGEFIAAFNHKSKMQPLLKTIPVNVINNPRAGLLGAVNYAVHAAKISH